jgi:PmbA protein
MRGSAIYRDASFLGGKLNEQLFPDWVNIAEQPHLLQALGSAPFDNEGVATTDKKLIDAGHLTTYLLDSYSARKLQMTTTGHAGGVRNPIIQSTGQSREALLKEMGTGLYITELMGQGSNTVTGDYSRGAAGFWIENGEIAYPVEEITVAGNLQQMFQDLEAVATDNDIPSSYNTGSWLIKQMTVAGN